MNNNIKGCSSQEARSKMKVEVKSIQRSIHEKLKIIEEEELDSKLHHIEQIRDDNTKYFYAIRSLQNANKNKKATIIVRDKEGNCMGSTKKFSTDEIQTIARRLNNDKACGPDEIYAEFIRHAPPAIHEKIADILNKTAATGDHPSALVSGLLLPIPKPGKPKGPPANLRPIILLSILRKSLSIALLQRIWDLLATRIPKDQAAYQRGRDTTEQVLALKLLIDKAITTNDYDILILQLDMSKALKS